MLIQGPPGSGKTYTSAKIILSLLMDGKKVGVTSNSHKAINNVLERIEKNAQNEDFFFEGIKVASKKDDKFVGKNIKSVSTLKNLSKNCTLYAGTAWLFSKNIFDQQLDYLFIDLPPGTGDIPLTLVQKIPLAGAFVVTTPQQVATLDAKKAIQMFQKTNITVLGIIENMTTHNCVNCGHKTHIFGQNGAQKLAEQTGCSLIGQLPLDQRITENADHVIGI